MLKFAVLCAIVIAPLQLRAQAMQIPFDSAGKIYLISPELQEETHLFPNVANFVDATLYKRRDGSMYIDILYFERETKLHNILEISDSAFQDMRRRVSVAERSHNPDMGLDQSSRSKFIIWETILSTTVTGTLVGDALSEDGDVRASYTLIGGALGFIIPFLATAHANVTDGESSLALGGAFLGYGHGAMIAELVAPGNSKVSDLFMAGTSILETGVGFAIADKYKIKEGKADVIRYTSLLGGLGGFGVAYIVGGKNLESHPALLAGLTGSALGVVGGAMLASDQHYTRGNASVLMTASLVAGGSMALLTSAAAATSVSSFDDFGRVATAATVLGMAGGYYGAHRYLANKNLSTAEGNYVILGSAAGYLLGEGVAVLVSRNGSGSPWAIALPIAISMSAGFLLMLNSAGRGSDHDDIGMRVGFNPGNWMAMNAKSDPKTIAPTALTLSYGW